ncbi:MAG: cytochrome c [Burkholderiales bacterium]|nr:cytochrome c [Burkholderiales bacterium]
MRLRRVLWGGLIAFGLVFVAWAALVVREFAAGALPAPVAKFSASAAQVERGEYLARIGNCAGCHTARGGEPYAGGRAVDTPFGAVYAGNLTPDRATGIGDWSSEDFYRALHEGRSRDGRMLYPAFPYPNFTQVTRDDSDAIYAYLRERVKPARRVNTAHSLSFPYDSALALATWRLLYFKPADATAATAPSQTAAWQRGAYLVQGLAHCGACHSTRNALGAPLAGHAYDGAMMPQNDWYAPSLTARDEASVADWPLDDIARWLQTGTSPQGAAFGPMAEIVFQSTQYLRDEDARAMAAYLKALPVTRGVAFKPSPQTVSSGRATAADRGRVLYEEHCANCHGKAGEGKASAWPALVGNRTVLMANTSNLFRVVLSGGFAPATAGNPQPHGMPPFYHLLGDDDLVALLNYVRGAWGNNAPAITTLDLIHYRDALRVARP